MLSNRYVQALAFTAILAGVAFAADPPAAKPNVVLILLDDVGWGDCGFQGAKDVPTPNIDSIAKGGVRFTDGYVCSPLCSPSRAGMMTGRYPTRFGHEFNESAAKGSYTFGMSLTETTLADRLKALGYSTAMVGKWQLGHDRPAYLPTERGFDEFFGTPRNTDKSNYVFYDTRKSAEPFLIKDPDFCAVEAYGERAADWISRQKPRTPFFLYLAFNIGARELKFTGATEKPAVLPAVEAPQKYLERFPNIEAKERREFAAMLSSQDDAIGLVLKKIQAIGQEENTFVIFLSDNGAAVPHKSNGPLHGWKGTTSEGGIRVPFCMRWPAKIPAGTTYEFPVSNLDILPTCVAAAGGPIDGKPKLDGVDLLPYITGAKTGRPHEMLYWRLGPQRAIRKGDFKLLLSDANKFVPKLVNIATDPGEKKDLREDFPELVEILQKSFLEWNRDQANPLWRPGP